MIGRCGINCFQFFIFLSTFPWHPPVPPLRDLHPGINPAFKTKAGTPPMTFTRMSRGFVCSSQRDKERDLNKSIYPRQQSTRPPFVWSAARCRAAGWHHAMPQQPKGAQGLSFPIVLGRFWETLQAALPLAPSPKVTAESQRGEGTLPVRRRLRTGAAARAPPLFSPSRRITSPPSSLLWVFGPLAPWNGPYHFFPLPNSGAHPNVWAGGVHAPPGRQHGVSVT